METINAEILTLTYGSIVRQLVADYEDVEEVNRQLEKMGYNIGQRLIDEYLAKSKTQRDFRDTADKIAKVGLKMFLNTTAAVTNWNAEGTECSLILEDNPLTDFVELPEGLGGLRYSNLLCGVVRGALEMVSLEVEASFVKERGGARGVGAARSASTRPAATLAAACDAHSAAAWPATDVPRLGRAPPAAQDMLRGDDVYEMRLKLLSSNAEAYPFKDDE
eukprot:scaffold13.g385.t1